MNTAEMIDYAVKHLTDNEPDTQFMLERFATEELLMTNEQAEAYVLRYEGQGDEAPSQAHQDRFYTWYFVNYCVLNPMKEIQIKIENNKNEAWEDDLEETIKVVILENFDRSGDEEKQEIQVYNHWDEDLNDLINSLDTFQTERKPKEIHLHTYSVKMDWHTKSGGLKSDIVEVEAYDIEEAQSIATIELKKRWKSFRNPMDVSTILVTK
jgi:hypothetical protein